MPILILALAAQMVVLNKEDATLAIVDPVSGKVSGVVPTGEGPHEVEVSTDGKLAFVTNYGARTPGNSLSVIDLAAKKELRRVDLSPMQRPHGIWMAEGKVWFSAESAKLIGRYDPQSNKVDMLLGTGQNGTHMVMLSRDNSKIFATNLGSDTVSVFTHAPDGVTWNQTVVPVGRGPEGLDITPDGREFWTAHSRDGAVSILDVETRQVKSTIDLGTKRSNRIKFTLDGKYALVSDLAGGELVIVDVASKKIVKKMALGKMPEGILMDPNGQRAYIAVAGDNHIAILDLTSLTVTGKLETGRGPDGMAWVPGH
ncbi:MAG: YncE family protein [Bryobacteraceae bacterium]|nr:YncE family protein [Bryobacteraceae bacterium]